jgi:UDP-N-acetylmuramyl pentapeptide phosphotransferase/UDP-N-acetylglucosamine-1-phosphate transferase
VATAVSLVFQQVSTLALIVVGSSILAALLGLAEDVWGLPIRARLVLQVLLGMLAGTLMAGTLGAPYWAVPTIGLCIAGYINVANFMDGIDGISAIHGLICGGYFALVGYRVGAIGILLVGILVAAGFAGFSPWNLGPRRAFLGDSGSYLLGATVSMLSIASVIAGAPLLLGIAPLLPYLADTAFTVIRRSLRTERLWEPHREHVYQRLLTLGLRHLTVAGWAGAVTLLCGIAALASNGQLAGWLACLLLVAAYLCSPLLGVFRRSRVLL